MLHWMQVWKHMRDLTERDIEKRAVMEVICYFEEQMNMVIRQSAEELDKRNELNEIQGLKQKQRIDQGCIRDAIRTINDNGHSSLSGRTGGMIQKVKKKNDKHPQENTEVA
jgi:hypothetical protein